MLDTRLDRVLAAEQAVHLSKHFLGTRYRHVSKVRITHVVNNAGNPRRELWRTWGTRMIRVWGEGQVSNSKLTPGSKAFFELNVFLRKDTDQPGYVGQINRTEALEGFDDTSGSAGDVTAELGTIIQGMLAEKFKSLADVEIIDIGRSPLHGAHVYEGRGRANAAENSMVPREHIRFSCRIAISTDGTITERKMDTWIS